MPSALSKLVAGVAMVAAGMAAAAEGKVYYRETFDDKWTDRWTQSAAKSEYGKFTVSHARARALAATHGTSCGAPLTHAPGRRLALARRPRSAVARQALWRRQAGSGHPDL